VTADLVEIKNKKSVVEQVKDVKNRGVEYFNEKVREIEQHNKDKKK